MPTSIVPIGSIDSPLPRRYLTTAPGIGGAIKTRPEDFIVEELPLYEPCDAGEHAYLRVQKTNVSHAELMSCVRRAFGVRDKAIGFAGMKDKAAVTRQTLSVRHPIAAPLPESLDHDRIVLQWITRHRNKIKRGHLAGNRFSIRIRDVDPVKVTQIRRQMNELQQLGVPNYFGPQRFGYRCNNHLLGLMMLHQDWDAMVAELLGATGTPFPEYQQTRRELFDAGRYEEAAMQWTPSDRNELTVIKTLRDGRNARAAITAIGKTALSFMVSALQSAVFNRVLDARLAAGELTTLGEGDLAWKHDSGAVFRVKPDDLEGDDLATRLEACEISPSGPLWGAGMMEPGPRVAAVEREALEAFGVTMDLFERDSAKLTGVRRPMRAPVRNAATDAGVDEHGPYIRVVFDLPPGSYATVLLRELMKNDQTPTP